MINFFRIIQKDETYDLSIFYKINKFNELDGNSINLVI